MNRTGVVAALVAEARTLGPPSPRRAGNAPGIGRLADGSLVAVSGIGAAAAAAAAGKLVQAGARALLSWGMAGGLDPALPAGTICLPDAVVDADGIRYPVDSRWRQGVLASLGRGLPVVGGTLLTSRLALDSTAAKAAAFAATGAAAVDMESAAVAGAAADGGLPFLAVRVIVDTAADSLPAVVMGEGRTGQVDPGRLLRGLLRSPSALWPLLRLARRYRAAIRGLAAVAGAGGLASGAFA